MQAQKNSDFLKFMVCPHGQGGRGVEPSDVNEKKKLKKNFENRRRDVISFNQLRGMPAKMAANGIRTHVRTNQRRTLASRSRQLIFDTATRVIFD